jgi:hypothetical protein
VQPSFVCSSSVRVSLVATLAAVAFGSACTEGQSDRESSVLPSFTGSPTGEPRPSAQPVSDYSTFIDALEAAGLRVREGAPKGGDGTFNLFEPSGRSVHIDGVKVSTYEYPSDEALDEFKRHVSDDGFEVPVPGGRTVIVEWDPPHFYAAGKLLLLYFGDKRRTLDVLDLLLGPSFAGGGKGSA